MRHTVCRIDELPPGSSRVVTFGETEVAVFNVDGEIVAIDNSCAHKKQPLADGVVRNGIITCPSHLWRYDLRSGKRTDAPGWSIARHTVVVEGASVVVEVPDPEPHQSIRDQLLEHAREWSRDE